MGEKQESQSKPEGYCGPENRDGPETNADALTCPSSVLRLLCSLYVRDVLWLSIIHWLFLPVFLKNLRTISEGLETNGNVREAIQIKCEIKKVKRKNNWIPLIGSHWTDLGTISKCIFLVQLPTPSPHFSLQISGKQEEPL